MARIEPLDRSQFAPELRRLTDHLTDEQLGSIRIYAHAPALGIAWMQFIEASRAGGSLPARTLELVRLRVALHNQCPRCMSLRLAPDDIDETTVCSIGSNPVTELADLTDAERVAVRFGDLMASDHLSIDDALFADLGQHFTTAEIVELALQSAMFVGFGRLGAVLRLVDDLPERYAQTGPLSYLPSSG